MLRDSTSRIRLTNRHCTAVDSEEQLEAELNSSTSTARGDHSGIGIRRAAIPGIGNTGGWIIQVHMVERIHEVRPQLEAQIFPQAKSLHGADIPVPEARSAQHISR